MDELMVAVVWWEDEELMSGWNNGAMKTQFNGLTVMQKSDK